MGLDVALTSALSGLKANQEMFGVLSQNIANVNNENYARRVVDLKSNSIAGVGQGVEIASVTRVVDNFLVDSMRQQTSKMGYSSVVQEFYDKIQQQFGKPGEKGNIAEVYNDFFSALKALSASPELVALRQSVANNGKILADKFSEMSYSLHELRYNSDQQLARDINNLNQNLQNLKEVNIAISGSLATDSTKANLLEERDVILGQIAKYIDISLYTKSNGEVYLSSANGKALLDENSYLIQYSPATGIDSFINNAPLDETIITIYNSETKVMGASKTLITGGTAGQINTELKSGELVGLIELRDKIVPDLINQLDNLAAQFRDEFNSIHNNGAGFPPPTIMTGTKLLIDQERRNWTGDIKIAIVDDSGNPIKQQSGQYLMPLTLKLSQLDSGYGAGQPNMQTIIDEINEYFYYDPIETKVSLGNLSNIKMVATSNFDVVPSGQVNLDFEVENNSQLDSQFQVVGVSVTDTGAAGLVSPLPGISNVIAGTRGKTATPIAINFAGGAGGPYKIHAQIKVTDSQGNVSFSTIEYIVNDNPGSINVINDRYNVNNIISGDGELVAASNTQRFAQAMLVDESGNPAASGTPGRLQIKTGSSHYHIVIDESNSQERGISQQYTPVYVAPQVPTYFGFSHFFGLNDFFVNNNDSQLTNAGSSLHMEVRADIVDNPNIVSLGKLSKSSHYYETQNIGTVNATGNIVFSGNPSIGDTISFNGAIFTYVAAASSSNQITLGGTLSQTLINTVATMNAVNSYTAGTTNKAAFYTDNVDSINVAYNAKGTEGNGVSLSANLSVAASINNQPLTFVPYGSLQGGKEEAQQVLINPNSYTLYKGSDGAISALANLSQKISSFNAAGRMPASTLSYVNYAAAILSKTVTDGIYASNRAEKDQMIWDGFLTRHQSNSGVNLDEELANTIIYQNAYSANARVIKITKELLDLLIQSI